MKLKTTWVIEDHLCKGCGGRILRCVSGGGPTGGGNPIFKCADCGTCSSGMSADVLCWCGFSMRQNHGRTAYRCLPFSILGEHPEWLSAFLACGCDPKRGEVGIVLEESILRARQEPAAPGTPPKEAK